jgi:hypothetical protein
MYIVDAAVYAAVNGNLLFSLPPLVWEVIFDLNLMWQLDVEESEAAPYWIQSDR